jgi:hypothetical protein
MFAGNGAYFRNLKETCRRSPRRVCATGASRRLAGLALAVAGLCALAPATASAAQPGTAAAGTVVHSAKSGQLSKGRLVLRGVHRRVTWTTNDGRSGRVSIRKLHRRLFLPGARVAGTLHIAGHRGGDEATLSLSRPRHSPARRTVSYRVRRLNNRPVPRRFGAASLSMVGRPLGGNTCTANIQNNTWNSDVQAVGHDTWPTSPMVGGPNVGDRTPPGNWFNWAASGGAWEGCYVQETFQVVPQCSPPRNGPNPCQDVASNPIATLTFNIEWDWGWKAPQHSCTSSDTTKIVCQDTTNQYGIRWSVNQVGS